MIKDRNIAWNRKRVFLKAADMSGIDVARTASLGAGVPVFQESVAGAELSGLAIAAAGDEIYDIWPLPWDLDRDQPLRLRLWFSHSSTDEDTPDWLVSYKFLGKQDAITDAASSPDEAVAFAAAAVSATADAMEILDWEETVSETKVASTDKAMLLAVEANGLGSASADEITLYGIEIEYTVSACGESSYRDTTEGAPVS